MVEWKAIVEALIRVPLPGYQPMPGAFQEAVFTESAKLEIEKQKDAVMELSKNDLVIYLNKYYNENTELMELYFGRYPERRNRWIQTMIGMDSLSEMQTIYLRYNQWLQNYMEEEIDESIVTLPEAKETVVEKYYITKEIIKEAAPDIPNLSWLKWLMIPVGILIFLIAIGYSGLTKL